MDQEYELNTYFLSTLWTISPQVFSLLSKYCWDVSSRQFVMSWISESQCRTFNNLTPPCEGFSEKLSCDLLLRHGYCFLASISVWVELIAAWQVIELNLRRITKYSSGRIGCYTILKFWSSSSHYSSWNRTPPWTWIGVKCRQLKVTVVVSDLIINCVCSSHCLCIVTLLELTTIFTCIIFS